MSLLLRICREGKKSKIFYLKFFLLQILFSDKSRLIKYLSFLIDSRSLKVLIRFLERYRDYKFLYLVRNLSSKGLIWLLDKSRETRLGIFGKFFKLLIEQFLNERERISWFCYNLSLSYRLISLRKMWSNLISTF